jgi:DNA-binding MarR family transcriptional regulator
MDTLKNPEVQKRLDGIVAKMPNHLSAKLLLEFGKGTNSKMLSIGGSFKEIQGASSGIFRQASNLIYRSRGGDDDKAPEIKITDEQQKEAKESIATLKKLEANIDPRLKSFTEVVVSACEAYANGPKKDEKAKEFTERLKEAMEKVQNAQAKLQKDPDIMEELMD